ncbi:iron-containing alcohol dehydrogenase [Pectinatus cerevisiiphilus]|uniref:Alcohol dehydrogenase class IV n=1 Tax=Pectinatus cerevisiiphilus TaxID=86956 RepID=A0A4R3KE39_9FIRM|nr:iron-containing alcohol dehydrogenase [Pectinatus cerevisiiphilus]TCS81360.1 alcohol dehydrogenase class IV [Pectinatus cerevisiiphilus]
MKRFTLPRDIYWGENALAELKNLKGKKAMLVLGGGSMRRFGFVDKVLAYLKEANIETALIEKVEPDPSVETVMQGAQKMRSFNPDWIIAMGGGSPIDAAKAMWVFYEYPDVKFEDIIRPFSFPTLRKKAKFLAIPSTSGTATEVTAFSVITDNKKRIKYPLADFNITPDIAIVDPALAQTMPPKLTAYTGMDALTHAIEAYVSSMHGPFTDPLAMQAIVTIDKYLEASYKGDHQAREQIHYAQCMAGMAFSNALLGITHSLAHKTGPAYSTGHIPHGCANAIYLPYVIAYNAKEKEALVRYAEIAKRLGIGKNTEQASVTALCDKLAEYDEKLNIPHTLKQFGINEEEFLQKLDYVASTAVKDACTLSNPRQIDKEQMAKLLKAIYYGSKVDF